MISLYVKTTGDVRRQFHVHQNLLCDVSYEFRDLLAQEPSTDHFTFRETHASTINQFLQWLYRGTFPLWSNGHQEHYMALARLSVFAEMYRITALEEVVTDTMLELSHMQIWIGQTHHMDRTPSPEIVEYVYANTSTNNPFRKILISWYIHHQRYHQGLQSDRTQTLLLRCPQFGAEMAIALAHEKIVPCTIHKIKFTSLNADYRFLEPDYDYFPKSVLGVVKKLKAHEQQEMLFMCCKKRKDRRGGGGSPTSMQSFSEKWQSIKIKAGLLPLQ